MNMLF